MRQPLCCPIQVIVGTPTTFAIVSPESTKATPRRACPAHQRRRRRGMRCRSRRRAAARDEAGEHHQRERRREGRGDGPDREGDEQPEQQLLARPAGRDGRDRRSADDDAEGVSRDDPARPARSPPSASGVELRQEVRARCWAAAPSRRTRSSRCRSRRGRGPGGQDEYGPTTASSARQERGHPPSLYRNVSTPHHADGGPPSRAAKNSSVPTFSPSSSVTRSHRWCGRPRRSRRSRNRAEDPGRAPPTTATTARRPRGGR